MRQTFSSIVVGLATRFLVPSDILNIISHTGYPNSTRNAGPSVSANGEHRDGLRLFCLSLQQRAQWNDNHPNWPLDCRPEPDSELLYDWSFNANLFVLVPSPLRPTTIIFLLQLNAGGYRPYVTYSLIVECVCRLQFLLTLSGPSRTGLMTTVYCLRL
jgi:hypothetical protein